MAQPLSLQDLRAGLTPQPQTICDLYPTASTFFHELLHLVYGHDETMPPDKRERYDLREMVQMPFTIASHNAESYTTAAVAYDYIRRSQPDEQGNYLDVATGFITQG